MFFIERKRASVATVLDLLEQLKAPYFVQAFFNSSYSLMLFSQDGCRRDVNKFKSR